MRIPALLVCAFLYGCAGDVAGSLDAADIIDSGEKDAHGGADADLTKDAGIPDAGFPTLPSPANIVLLGDSNTQISYAEAQSIVRWSDKLQSELGQAVVVQNWGRGDQWALDFLEHGFDWPTNGDLYVIGFTLNDARLDFQNLATRRFDTIEEASLDFKANVEALIAEVRGFQPESRIVLMSAVWTDAATHFSYDIDSQSALYAQRLQEVADSSANTVLLDIYNEMRLDSEWDFRVRRDFTPDDSGDREGIAMFGIHWFTNVHLNQRGNDFVEEKLRNLIAPLLP